MIYVIYALLAVCVILTLAITGLAVACVYSSRKHIQYPEKHPEPEEEHYTRHEREAERRAREMDEGVDNILRFEPEHIGIRGEREERDWDG